MVMFGFWFGVAFGLILSMMLEDLNRVWKAAVRREATLAVVAMQQQEGEKK